MDDDGSWNFNRCDYWQPGYSELMTFINKTGLSLRFERRESYLIFYTATSCG